MDHIARAVLMFTCSIFRGCGASPQPAAMDQPANASRPIETSAEALRDKAAGVDGVLPRRHVSKLGALGCSRGRPSSAGSPPSNGEGQPAGPLGPGMDAATTGRDDDPHSGTYRLVNRAEALHRWQNGVPVNKRADRIRPDWVDV